jgi:hypothetical protein
MYAVIKLGVEKHLGALLVPAAALIKEKTGNFLFILSNGKAQRSAVKMGFADAANVEILEGIAEGDQIIIPGKLTLSPGQAVVGVPAR